MAPFFIFLKERTKSIDENLEVNVIGDHYKTNHSGTESANGIQIEGRKGFSKNTAVSLSYMNEGKDDR